MDYILSIDQGTSSSRAMLYRLDGQMAHSSAKPVTSTYPKPGWVEQDPEQIWQSVLQVIADVTRKVNKKQIFACGITNQRETFVLWDKKTGVSLTPAIVWQDRRTEALCKDLSSHSETVHLKTGLQLDPYFSASKLSWVLNKKPELKALSKRGQLAFGTIDSFLIYRLTNGKSHITDITNASRTLLFNIFEQQWDNELLSLFQIPSSILPKVQDSDSHFGFIDKDIIDISVPITGVAGDQHASLIGHQCFEAGMLKSTYGTGGFLFLNTGDKAICSKDRLLTTIAYKIQGKIAYGLEGSIYQAGSIIRWLRDNLKLISHAKESDVIARNLNSNEGVYLIPSFNGLGAPHWLNIHGAMLIGLSSSSTSEHIVRAALESVCYQTRDILQCMRYDSGLDLSTICVDGGMADNEWFLSFLGLQCRAEIQKAAHLETTALGAAMLAGIGLKRINPKELQPREPVKKIYQSLDTIETADKDYQGWCDALDMLSKGYELKS